MSDVLDIPQQETSAEADDFEAAFAEFSGDQTPDVPVVAEEVTQDDPVEETPEATEQVPDTAPAPEQQDDPFSGLSEKQVEYFKELQKKAQESDHTIKSQIGRVSALQRKINELESLKKQPQTDSTQDTPLPGDPEWESFKSDYPQIATVVERRLASLDRVLNEKVGQATQPIRELQHERYINSQFAALEAAHPDYKDVVADSNFRSWLSAQPPQIQAFAASEDANEASYLLTTYKALTAPKQQVASGPSAVTEIKEQRKARLESSTGVQARGATSPSVGGAPDDFDSAFSFFANKRETKR